MPSQKKIKLLRFFERFVLIIIIALVVLVAFFWVEEKIDTNALYAGGGLIALSFMVLLFIQRSIDSLFSVVAAQTAYGQDDAFSALFDRSPVAYLIVNTEGIIMFTNAAAVKLLGGETGTIEGTGFFKLIQPEEGFDPAVLTGKISAGVTMNDTEVRLQTFSKREVWVMMSVFTYRSSGQRLIALVDITEQKHVDIAKSEFVALATHQLRTPIAAIRWNVELLEKKLRDIKTEDHERYLAKIYNNVSRMVNLINDFLSVSKLEMGTYASHEEQIDLRKFLSGVLEEFEEKISEKNISLEQQYEPEMLVVKIDTRLLHITLSNLLSNAIKYLNPEGKIELSYRLSGDRLLVVVADNGIGIPEGELDNLFTKFFRASNAQSHQTQGTGLGLYIVKQSVEQLGGKIEVISQENNGSRFSIDIPIKLVSAQ